MRRAGKTPAFMAKTEAASQTLSWQRLISPLHSMPFLFGSEPVGTLSNRFALG